MKLIILTAIAGLLFTAAFSQTELTQFNAQRNRVVKNGMLVLGSWGAANMIAGGIGVATASGESKYFHQMNLIWGSVNFAIAGASYLGLRKKQPAGSLSQSVKEQVGIEKTFLINGGLDLVYITAGLYCLEKGNTASNRDKYKGYGKSLLMQGGGLLLFDAIMYTINTRHGKQLYKWLDKVQFSGTSAGVVWKL